MEIRKRDESPTKEFVDVIAVHWAQTGKTEPVRIQMEGGVVLVVSKVLDVRRAASLRAGGQGIRYDCRVANENDGFLFRMYLYHDGDYWFTEKTKGGSDIVCVDGTLRKLSAKNWKSS